jgi:hypothetical protein
VSALSRAFVACFCAVAELVAEAVMLSAQPDRKSHSRRVERMMERGLQSLKNAHELLYWIYPSTSPLAYATAMKVANQMNASGFPVEWGHDVIQGIGKRRKGRPGTKRAIAIRAKELKVADAKHWTWPKITAALCDCGRSEHTIRCQDNLRREVAHLEKALTKCGCKL